MKYGPNSTESSVLEITEIQIGRQKGVTLYAQIKQSIRDVISKTPEGKSLVLPPQRDLAEKLGVSRNTVRTAYAQLEREGLVSSQIGKGTIVLSPANTIIRRNKLTLLSRIIEHSFEEALSLGFVLEEYQQAVKDFLREKKKLFGNVKLAFAECNNAQLHYFAKHLLDEPGVTIIPILLPELRKHPQNVLSKLLSADVVVTSFYHTDELEKLIPPGGPPLVGISLHLEMSSIVQIARIDKDARIGLISLPNPSKDFIIETNNILRNIGVDLTRVRRFSDMDEEKTRTFIHSVDTVLVTPSRTEQAMRYSDSVIELVFVPDEGSANSIRISLAELKKLKRKEIHGHQDHGTDVPGTSRPTVSSSGSGTSSGRRRKRHDPPGD